MNENLKRRSLNDAALQNSINRRGVATAAVASMGLLGNVDQAKAYDQIEVDTKFLPGTDVKLFPKDSKGLNRFKAMTQDLSKYSPEE